MKKSITVFFIMSMIIGLLSAQVITTFPFEETFTSTTFPPTGWSLLHPREKDNNWFRSLEGQNAFARSNTFTESFDTLDVDNYLVTPALQIPVGATAELSYQIRAFNSSGPDTVFHVMISTTEPTIANFTSISTFEFAVFSWQDRTLPLSDYAGQTIYLAFRHYDPELEYGNMGTHSLGIRNISVTAQAPSVLLNENFNESLFPPAGWSMLDLDGDGRSWVRTWGYPPYPPGSQANAMSETWIQDGQGYQFADPDNWLITPAMTIPSGSTAILSYLIRTLSELGWRPSDTYSVLVSTTSPSPNHLPSSFTTIFTETLLGVHQFWTERIFSLEQYSGQTIYIAFRHHDIENISNAYMIGLGNVLVTVPQPGDHDLVAQNILGEADLTLNMPTTHTVRVFNAGNLQAATYTVRLILDGNGETPLVLAEIPGTSILPDAIIDFPITWTPRTEGNFQIYAEIDYIPDQNLANNTTSMFNISVVDSGAPILIPVIVGNLDSPIYHRNPPFDIFDNSSVAQTLYFPNEFDYTGLITEIGYKFERSVGTIPSIGIEIFMATTTQTTLNAWVPYDNFVLVYEGFFPTITQQGYHDIRFQLDVPFPYAGGNENLVVMTHRKYGDRSATFHTYQVTQSSGRVRDIVADIDVNPANGFFAGQMRDWHPNTWFTVQTTHIGSLSGIVRFEAAPVSDVEIELTGTGIKSFTNAQGEYNFNILPSGLINLTVSKVMYTTQIIDVNITADENNILDIDLMQYNQDIAAISISGTLFPTADQENIYNIGIRNEGATNIAGTAYTVQLKQVIDSGDDVVLATSNGVDLIPEVIQTIPIIWTPTINTPSMDIYGFVVFDTDQNPDNNATEILSITIMEPNSGFAYIGNPTSDLFQDWVPFNVIWDNGITQTIYFEHEVGSFGWITHLEYDYYGQFNNLNGTTSMRIYLGSTNQMNYTHNRAWVPIWDHIKVFDGEIDFRPDGHHKITVPLDPPFLYEGGNLVVTGNKLWGEWDNFKQIRSTFSPTNRNMHAGSEMSVYEPETGIEQYWGWFDEANNFYPNVGIRFFTGGGRLTGTVTSQGGPVAGVKISVDGTSRYVFSDANGVYNLPYIEHGTVAIRASGIGYIDFVDNNVQVVQGEISTLNIPMQLMPNTTVSGRIVASDTGLGLSDAKITLKGYVDREVTTNAEGNFTLNTVFSNFSYQIVVVRDGYNKYESDITVGTSPLNLGDIIIIERTRPPRNVIAYEDSNNLVLNWDAPRDGTDKWFSHTTQETFYDGAGMGEPFFLKYGHRFTEIQLKNFGVSGGYLDTVSFMPADPPVFASFVIEIYIGGSFSPINPGTRVHRQTIPDFLITQRQWVDVELTTLIPIPSIGEMWIIIEMTANAGYPAGIDNGPVLDGYGNIIYHQGVWTTLLQAYPQMPYNFMVKAMAESVPAISDRHIDGGTPSVRTNGVSPLTVSAISDRHHPVPAISDRHHPVPAISDRHITYQRRPAVDVAIGDRRYAQRRDAVATPRVLLGYNIYRALNTTPTQNWEPIATNITGTTYTDETWSQAANDSYRYIVEAIYTDDILSLPAYSGMIAKGMQSLVNISIILPDNGSINGATVRLVNKNGNPDYEYQMVATSNLVAIPLVWKGDYTLSIRHQNYYDYVSDITVNISPFEYQVFIQKSDILIQEGFEGSFPPAGWTRIDADGDSYNWQQYGLPNVLPYSGYEVAGSMSWLDNGTVDGIPLSPDNWLITSQILLSGDKINLRYYVATDDVWFPIERYSVLFSATSPELSNFVPLLTEDLNDTNYHWQERNIDLSELSGLSIYLAFRHHGSFDQFMVKIDDVLAVCAVPLDDEMFYPPRNLTAFQVTNTNDVELNWIAPVSGSPTGYRIERGEHIVSSHTQNLTIIDNNVPDGKHTYNVYAVYANGESNPASVIVDVVTSGLDDPLIPLVTALSGNYPNPFNPTTIIAFDLANESNVNIEIFNIRGQLVYTLINDLLEPGRYKLEWNGTDNNGRNVSSGVYFYQMKTEDYSNIKRMVLMK